MKPNAVLVVTSLLSILLLTLHVTDNIVRGISKAEPANIALLVLTVLLYGTLVLAERRSGHVIMLLVGLFAAAMPVLHIFLSRLWVPHSRFGFQGLYLQTLS